MAALWRLAVGLGWVLAVHCVTIVGHCVCLCALKNVKLDFVNTRMEIHLEGLGVGVLLC